MFHRFHSSLCFKAEILGRQLNLVYRVFYPTPKLGNIWLLEIPIGRMPHCPPKSQGLLGGRISVKMRINSEFCNPDCMVDSGYIKPRGVEREADTYLL